MSTLLKNLLIAIGITLLLVVVYMLMSGGEEEVANDFNPSGLSSEVNQEVERILADTEQIDSYNIEKNDDILEEPRFNSLIDRHVEIQDQEIGRENPFAPVR